MARTVSYSPITIAARRVLLDALEALEQHREGLVLVGAQAIYLYTGDADVAIATTTKDSDIALIPVRLASEPTLDAAMTAAGFSHDRSVQQPGEWSSGEALDPPVDLLVPEGLHAGGGRRGARIPPHSTYAARVVPGLEVAAMSHRQIRIASLEPDRDSREVAMRVASPAGLLVAKAYKIGERATTAANRLLDKDAHDLYRLLRAVPPGDVVADLRLVLSDDVAGPVTDRALMWLGEHADTHEALIPTMAGRAEALVGEPEDVSQRTWALIQEILDDVGDDRT
ncbi:MAG TPA: hypothetical protein VNT32_03345 [Thermoleophilaceae bacterium]|nr:hypothetical protein [Thermoleophilaceae bacterium]